MEFSHGPVAIKSCHLCEFFEVESSGEVAEEEMYACVHPVRLADPDDNMLLDKFLHTPADCPVEKEDRPYEPSYAQEIRRPLEGSDDEE